MSSFIGSGEGLSFIFYCAMVDNSNTTFMNELDLKFNSESRRVRAGIKIMVINEMSIDDS